MKKLYFCLWFVLWAPICLLAQVSDPTRATLDNIFAPLDKSQVPTGFLAEDALPLVPLDVFNGTLTDSSRTSPDGFRYLYATLYSARVYGTQPLLSVQDYNTRTANAIAGASLNTIPVMVQRVDYATVRSDAFSLNLLTYSNGQVRDVAGRSQSPYLVRTVFAAAPTSSSSTTGAVSLVLSSALEVRSGGPAISARYLDFGDGRGYLSATPDQALSVNYSTTGPKRVKVRYTYSDASSLESWFDITVLNVTASPAAATAGSGNKGPSPLSTFDDIITPISGVRAGGTAHYILGTGHTQITKPFIVAEGFDPSDVAPIIQKSLTITDFKLATTTKGSFDFYNSYINAGYDLIYIDYDSGTGDILLNVALFEEVLNRVNKVKTGSEQNVVMGISMGGLVARYGLADMEKAQPGSTQTRLLILQDSPQRGANVPLGVQALLRQVSINFGSFTIFDINKYLQQATALLDSPASQQLLLYRATDASSGFAANTFIEGSYRQKITFPTGQTPPYQIIAASQGSQCGTPLFAPYTELARVDGKIFISPFPWIKRTTYYAQTIVNALPASGQSNRVATLQLYTIVRLFGFINLRVDFIRQDYSCPSGLLAVDGVAGGTNYIGGYVPAGTLPKPASYGFGPFFQLAYSYNFTKDFCFVPTASALDLNDFNQTTLGGQNINGISSTSFSRTNSFIAYSPQENPSSTTSAYSNEFHTTFTARNSAWMFSNMQGASVPSSYCSTECNPAGNLQISGPITLCGSGTYTSPLQAQGYTYSWAASPASAFTVSSGSGPTFQTANIGNTSGTITLTVKTPCPVSFTKQVVIGAPQYPTSEEFDRSDICYGVAHIRIDNYDPGLTYTVRGYRATAIYDHDGTLRLKVGGNQTNASYTITASNGCGTITSDQTSVDFTCASSYSYATYPNPSNDAVMVEQQNSAAQNQSAQPSTARAASSVARTSSTSPMALTEAASFLPYTVRLYDTYGKLWLELPALAPTLQLRTANLPAGSYLMQVLVAGIVVQRVPLGVQH